MAIYEEVGPGSANWCLCPWDTYWSHSVGFIHVSGVLVGLAGNPDYVGDVARRTCMWSLWLGGFRAIELLTPCLSAPEDVIKETGSGNCQSLRLRAWKLGVITSIIFRQAEQSESQPRFRVAGKGCRSIFQWEAGWRIYDIFNFLDFPVPITWHVYWVCLNFCWHWSPLKSQLHLFLFWTIAIASI